MCQAGGTSQLAPNAMLNIPQIVGGALNNQFLMQAGATLTSAVQVLADASLTFSLGAGARARFSSLNLSAVSVTHAHSIRGYPLENENARAVICSPLIDPRLCAPLSVPCQPLNCNGKLVHTSTQRGRVIRE